PPASAALHSLPTRRSSDLHYVIKGGTDTLAGDFTQLGFIQGLHGKSDHWQKRYCFKQRFYYFFHQSLHPQFLSPAVHHPADLRPYRYEKPANSRQTTSLPTPRFEPGNETGSILLQFLTSEEEPDM